MLNILSHREMQINLNLTRFHSIPVRLAIIKKITDNILDEDAGRNEPSCTVGGNVN
jgi:hypothetical protein